MLSSGSIWNGSFGMVGSVRCGKVLEWQVRMGESRFEAVRMGVHQVRSVTVRRVRMGTGMEWQEKKLINKNGNNQ